jgi:hypothetical protein
LRAGRFDVVSAAGCADVAGRRNMRIPAYAIAIVKSGLTMLNTAKGA